MGKIVLVMDLFYNIKFMDMFPTKRGMMTSKLIVGIK